MINYKETIFSNLIPLFSIAAVSALSYGLSSFTDGAIYSIHLIPVLLAAIYSSLRFTFFITVLALVSLIYFNIKLNDSPETLRIALYLTGALFIATIIRKLKAALEENKQLLEKANHIIQEKRELLGVVSHDLRNPLGSIMMNAQVLKKKAEDPQSVIVKADAIVDLSKSMNTLINDLLEFSTLESNSSSLELSPTPVTELFQRLQNIFELQAKEKGLSITYEHTSNEIVKADFEKAIRVFSNLIGNAIKFSPEGGTIKVKAVNEGKFVCFSVHDHGPGINEEHLKFIFDRFWQSGLMAHKGAGLGLSIAKNIVEAHGGKMRVESKFGHGTTFFFTLCRA